MKGIKAIISGVCLMLLGIGFITFFSLYKGSTDLFAPAKGIGEVFFLSGFVGFLYGVFSTFLKEPENPYEWERRMKKMFCGLGDMENEKDV